VFLELWRLACFLRFYNFAFNSYFVHNSTWYDQYSSTRGQNQFLVLFVFKRLECYCHLSYGGQTDSRPVKTWIEIFVFLLETWTNIVLKNLSEKKKKARSRFCQETVICHCRWDLVLPTWPRCRVLQSAVKIILIPKTAYPCLKVSPSPNKGSIYKSLYLQDTWWTKHFSGIF
jgi:hypothetical protein